MRCGESGERAGGGRFERLWGRPKIVVFGGVYERVKWGTKNGYFDGQKMDGYFDGQKMDGYFDEIN